MVERDRFELSKAEPSDLQSDPFSHSGTSPKIAVYAVKQPELCKNRNVLIHIVLYI